MPSAAKGAETCLRQLKARRRESRKQLQSTAAVGSCGRQWQSAADQPSRYSVPDTQYQKLKFNQANQIITDPKNQRNCAFAKLRRSAVSVPKPNLHFALNAAIAFRVKSESTSLPVIAGRSGSSLPQSSVPFHITRFNSAMASGL